MSYSIPNTGVKQVKVVPRGPARKREKKQKKMVRKRFPSKKRPRKITRLPFTKKMVDHIKDFGDRTTVTTLLGMPLEMFNTVYSFWSVSDILDFLDILWNKKGTPDRPLFYRNFVLYFLKSEEIYLRLTLTSEEDFFNFKSFVFYGQAYQRFMIRLKNAPYFQSKEIEKSKAASHLTAIYVAFHSIKIPRFMKIIGLMANIKKFIKQKIPVSDTRTIHKQNFYKRLFHGIKNNVDERIIEMFGQSISEANRTFRGLIPNRYYMYLGNPKERKADGIDELAPSNRIEIYYKLFKPYINQMKMLYNSLELELPRKLDKSRLVVILTHLDSEIKFSPGPDTLIYASDAKHYLLLIAEMTFYFLDLLIKNKLFVYSDETVKGYLWGNYIDQYITALKEIYSTFESDYPNINVKRIYPDIDDISMSYFRENHIIIKRVQ